MLLNILLCLLHHKYKNNGKTKPKTHKHTMDAKMRKTGNLNTAEQNTTDTETDFPRLISGTPSCSWMTYASYCFVKYFLFKNYFF